MDQLMIFAAISAFFVKGMCGFANTLVFTTMTSFRYPNIDITPVELIVGYPTNLVIAWKERKNTDIKIWLFPAILVCLGSIPGMLFLKNANAQHIKLIFGMIVMILGAEMLVREYYAGRGKSSKAVLFLIGALSGLISGLYGIGALLAAYMSRTTKNSGAFKGNICIVFMIENTFRIIIYLLSGIINKEVFVKAAYLMPFMAVGLAGGLMVSGFMPEKIIKRLVIIMLIISGAALVIKNISV
ncbi:sulfite exporter TauE/SafE family protein [Kineothrix sp. MB12-C1]|uniref:sulfite exporter TauE/SafE family protein n=1 Tax=Kineothrix sp. MB12-C1 TaxID=3070215 RepID=UPI0027D29542|nr:sulfite exporter TauE/SafE family protein [Kineothrix sp. MB12-C1]WMC93751.1 sulfite exporter TauE/SafE family protein [Kineothrix sp. MB12-C1]